MKLFPIPAASVQCVTCQCGLVLHVEDGVARCTSCRRVHTVTVVTTQGGKST